MVNRILYLCILLLLTGTITGQKMGFKSSTRAVVVGISDYQDKEIPDLKYAHNDAVAFADYLKSKAGGSVPEDQIFQLTNENATIAQIYAALDWLIDETQKGDQVIIYLSGHGDVETKTIRQRGYYLAYDSPANNYRIGAVRLEDLNDVIATLSQSNEAKVVIISDACRSGKLAGNGVDGTQVTASAFSAQYAKELRILSCQPNEYSLEGQQWGGGRGVFSYHLIDGLIGLADSNSDEMVNLREVERYLEDNVSREAMPQHQNPMVVGNKLERVSLIDTESLAELKKRKKAEKLQFGMVGTKELAFGKDSKMDSTIAILYEQFNTAIEEQYFLPRDTNAQRIPGQSASELYDVLINEETLASYHNTMKRNFAAALQDVAQQSLNAYLRADKATMRERWIDYGKAYSAHPDYLAKAAKLLGPDHYIYDQILVKKYYFEGLIERLEGNRTRQDSFFQRAFNKVDTALNYDDQAAYVFNELGVISAQMKNTDAAIDYYTNAISLAPTWVLPVSNLFTVYKLKRKYEQAIEWADRAIAIDSNYSQPYYNKALIYRIQGDLNAAKNMYLKSLEKDSSLFRAHYNLAYFAHLEGRFLEAFDRFKKSTEMNPEYFLGNYFLAVYYLAFKDVENARARIQFCLAKAPNDMDVHLLEAELFLIEGDTVKSENKLMETLQKDTLYEYTYATLVEFYLDNNLDQNAQNYLTQLTALNSNNEMIPYLEARIAARNNDEETCLNKLEEAFQKEFEDRLSLENEKDFEAIRSNPEYQRLIQQYFSLN